MSKVMVHELIEQYHHTFRIFCEEVQRFDDHQWLTGLSYFQVPARQAMHILDCLDFYFTPGGGEPYR